MTEDTLSSHHRLTRHRGLATWGERLVPLEMFRREASRHGTSHSSTDLAAHRRRFLEGQSVAAPPAAEGPFDRVVVFGGVYSNRFALAAVLDEARRWHAQAVYCLGDLGGFGPLPEASWDLLQDGGVRLIQGNYEQALASGREDCNCGYADPRDNHFAELSYRYTAAHCSQRFREWMGAQPLLRRVRIGESELLLCHGSPRRINEFLFDSSTPDAFLEVLLDQHRCDGVLCTHSGLHWHRRLASGRDAVNVGVIGRPANNGELEVWYCKLSSQDGGVEVSLCPLRYDYQALAREMRAEGLPAEFVETIETGWWTSCLEVLPAKERARSRF
jgi:hypothetical protein